MRGRIWIVIIKCEDLDEYVKCEDEVILTKINFSSLFSHVRSVRSESVGLLERETILCVSFGQDGFHICERFFKRHSCLYLAILGTFVSRTTDDYGDFFTSSHFPLSAVVVWFFLCYIITSRDLRAISIIATIHPEREGRTPMFPSFCFLIKETLIKKKPTKEQHIQFHRYSSS